MVVNMAISNYLILKGLAKSGFDIHVYDEFHFFWHVLSAFRLFSDLVKFELRVNDTLTRWFLSNAILTLKKYRSVLFYHFNIKPHVRYSLNITCKPAFHVWLHVFQHVCACKWDTNIFLSWVWGMKLVKNETRSILMAKKWWMNLSKWSSYKAETHYILISRVKFFAAMMLYFK